jgi:hypothetical protein
MSVEDDLADCFAEQANVDFRAWELYETHPQALAAQCHKLLFLQMACEKLCKAHKLRAGDNPDSLIGTHKVITKHLPRILREEMVRRGQKSAAIERQMHAIRHLAQEVELLSPSVDDDKHRPDNCEYPWLANGKVISPLRWSFAPLQLCTQPGGRSFLKLVRCAIDRNLPVRNGSP